MNFHSKYMEDAVDQISSLPGIGKKTALRLALTLLKRKPEEIERFAMAVMDMKEKVKYCSSCGNMTDEQICVICKNPARDHGTVCVVEDIRDVMAIEDTGIYKGIYHVLGGIISPMDGVGPSDLNIQKLLTKMEEGYVKEIILALSSTMEGETTNFYLYKKLRAFDVKVSAISKGISFGSELQYADEVTLGRALMNRSSYQND